MVKMRTEADLVKVVKKSFEDKGFLVNAEVQMLSKRIDLLCLNPETGEITAIEVKIKNWKVLFNRL